MKKWLDTDSKKRDRDDGSDEEPMENKNPKLRLEKKSSTKKTPVKSPAGSSSNRRSSAKKSPVKNLKKPAKSKTPVKISDLKEALRKIPNVSARIKEDNLRNIEKRAKELKPSPTKEEMAVYISTAKKLHKEGSLSLIEPGCGGSMGQARVVEKMRIAGILEKESRYYSEQIARAKEGEKDYTKAQMDIDAAVFRAEKEKSLSTLAILGDRTLETTLRDVTASDISTDVSTDTAYTDTTTDDDVFESTVDVTDDDEVTITYEEVSFND